MQIRLRTLFILIALATIPLVFIALLPHPRSVWLGYEHQRQRAYEKIIIGEHKTLALELLGEPLSTETFFSREISYRESEFPAEDIAKCVEFIVWRNGGNWFYCVGIDDNGRIVLKSDGHS